MKRNIIIFASLFFLLGGQGAWVSAQTKRLDIQQAFGQKTSLTKPISLIRGWVDASHYLERNPRDGLTYQVHIETEERTRYNPPPTSDVSVFVREQDIYITYGDGAPIRLTDSPDVEEK